MANGRDVEYGGFVVDRKTGEEHLLFTTTCSELLCRKRTEEAAISRTKQEYSDYDLSTLKIRYREVTKEVTPWHEKES